MRAIKMLKDINEKIVKIPSHEAYYLDLINYALKNFKIVFLSVGALKQEELKKIIKLRKNKNLIPLHCVSGYPLESQDCNFFKMEYLKKHYKNFGYSGHFSGIQDAIYAMCNGAKFIEKHFTINKNLPGRDNKFALDPNELNTLSNWKNFIRDFKIKKGLGLQKVEMDIYKNYRGRWGK
jgi:sialic acid synthase SpsE